MKDWLKTVFKRLVGITLEEERQKTDQVINQARCTVRDSRAMLNGEDYWLIPERKSCDDRK
jgi:hypothetical protein